MAERFYAQIVGIQNATAFVDDLLNTKLLVKGDLTITPVSDKHLVVTYYNDIPVVSLADGATVSYEYGSDAPTWADLVDITDGDSSTGFTLTVNTSLVDMDTVGTFNVSYVATDASGNASDTFTLEITITDTVIPVITDSVGATSYEAGTTEPDWTVGVTANDAYDGDITADIVVTSTAVDMDTVGTFDVTYDVDDSSGNSATTVTRAITIEDTTAPVIAGVAEDFSLEYGTTEPTWTTGVTSTDAYDGDLTSGIVITYAPAIDMNVIGDYVITYTSTDANSNEAVETVTMSVVDTVAPVITLTATTSDLEYTDASSFAGGASNVASATDAYDGDVSGNVVITYTEDDVSGEVIADLATAKTYLATVGNVLCVAYNVDDASGNSAEQKTLTITSVDTTGPVFSGVSATASYVTGASEPDWASGVTATDAYDGVLTSSITIDSSAVDMDTVASPAFSIYYSVTDLSGNTTVEETVVTITAS